MSFLKGIGGGSGGGLLNINPSSLDTFGKAMNGIASAGGASAGYSGADINNHLQLLDPNTLAAVLAHFKTPVSPDLANPRRLGSMQGFYQ